MTALRAESRATLRTAMGLGDGIRARQVADLRGITEKAALHQLDRMAVKGIFRKVEISTRRFRFEFVDRQAVADLLDPPTAPVVRKYPCSFVFNLGASA
jgi:hypothetical protein